MQITLIWQSFGIAAIQISLSLQSIGITAVQIPWILQGPLRPHRRRTLFNPNCRYYYRSLLRGLNTHCRRYSHPRRRTGKWIYLFDGWRCHRLHRGNGDKRYHQILEDSVIFAIVNIATGVAGGVFVESGLRSLPLVKMTEISLYARYDKKIVIPTEPEIVIPTEPEIVILNAVKDLSILPADPIQPLPLQ